MQPQKRTKGDEFCLLITERTGLKTIIAPFPIALIPKERVAEIGEIAEKLRALSQECNYGRSFGCRVINKPEDVQEKDLRQTIASKRKENAL